jgi:hypothetical protein
VASSRFADSTIVNITAIERRASRPLLSLSVLLERNRGAAYLSIGISGIGSFPVFLFLTYYLEDTLRFSPVETGLAFLPMVGLLVVFLAGAALAAVLFRSGPLPVDADAESIPAL